MKRFVLIATSLMLCLAMLAGCAKKSEDVPETTAETNPGDEVWDQVVAECGTHKLDNATLNYYFWTGYGAFLDYYDTSSQSILDLYTPLNEQQFNESMTWEDYFLENALTAFRQYSAINDLAAEKGFQLSENSLKLLDGLEDELNATAAELGFENGLEYLQYNYGPGATLENYKAYMKDYMTVYEYVGQTQSEYTFTDAEVEANYDDNAESYAQNGIKKDDRNMVSIRYLTLFEYDNPWENSKGETISSAGDVFDQILDEWENTQNHSEEDFMSLGEEWVQYGVQQNLVEAMSPDNGNDAQIDEWAFDPQRQPGDYYAMSSNAGYFLLYFVKTCDTTYWYQQSLYDLQYNAFNQVVSQRVEELEFTADPYSFVIAQSQDLYAE